MELGPGHLAATTIIALVAFSLGLWVGHLPITSLEGAAKLAPLGTAIIASFAAIIAAIAVFVQRDTARRRAAIDFFLKTEMDADIITAYHRFQELVPAISQIIARLDPLLDNDYRELRKWLNICELIAVGVNRGAFSNRVTCDYWGDVLPDTFSQAKAFILYIRQTPGHGSPATYCDLEKLCRRWTGA